MEENKSKGIFLGVVGVATLIVAIIGATFAYFVASASGNTNAVQAAGADVSGTLKLDEDVSGIKNNMIPVSEEVMKKSFVQAGTGATAKCAGISKTEEGSENPTVYNLCSTYVFTLKNTASIPQTVYASLESTANGFTNLYYCIYEDENSIDTETVACGAVPAVGDITGARAKNIFNVTLPAGSEETPSTAKYSLVLYINETGGDQTPNDSGATYTGTLKVTSSDGSNYMTGAVVTQVSP